MGCEEGGKEYKRHEGGEVIKLWIRSLNVEGKVKHWRGGGRGIR